MPLFYGVICSMGLMGAALVILMTGQIFAAHPKMSGFHSPLTDMAVVARSNVPSPASGNKQRTDPAAK